ncbi:MAG TPA: carboxypeptidase-like regulatory domain-containing protein [Salinimicrobium sp.]|nr:carboxypeptidase-like regulatory domain-containing protein [Salinimicrobium sp.]
MICFLSNISFAQEVIKGKILDEVTNVPIPDVQILLENGNSTLTDENGIFGFQKNQVFFGNQVLEFSKEGYVTKRFPVIVSEGKILNLAFITLKIDVAANLNQSGLISLSPQELDEEEGGVDNIAGLLHATKDVFLNAAAYDFSATFFRPRGLDSDQSVLMINGIEMNKIFNGRPQWSNWGGLNDAQRNQVFSRNLTVSDNNFGGLSGTTNIIMRASQYKKGGKITYAFANRSYKARMIGVYNTGMNNNGWAMSVLLSKRYADEGFNEGTLYDANSFFLSVEKKINSRHSLNFTAFYTPNIRGKSAAKTQEVVNLKGTTYNSFWGMQNGKIRNSRIKTIREPVFMLNHYFSISEKTSLNTNIGYQFGSVGNSRLDYGGSSLSFGPENEEIYSGGGSNPDPSYYQYMPSYFLRNEDNLNYEAAYLAQQEFLNNGQVDWNRIYEANALVAAQGGNSVYVLYEDINEDKQYTMNSILSSQISDDIKINASVSYKNFRSKNYAKVNDLLGGTGYLDVDAFSENSDEAQNDLQNRNRIVGIGDKFKYNFLLNANIFDAFAQFRFDYNQWEFFVSGKTSYVQYQRDGIFQNGNFPEHSKGKSELLRFFDFNSKAGVVYKIDGHHYLESNIAFLSRAPNLRNSFSNSRQNNDVVKNIKSEKGEAIDMSYIYRSPQMNLRISGFFNHFHDGTEISFYYADGISGIEEQNTSTAFVQEILTGIEMDYLGLEFGADFSLTSTIKLRAAGSIGEYIYSSNPFLYLTSDDFNEPLLMGSSHLKNYHIAGGPENAFQLGFEYRDPSFWWFSTSINWFSDAYIDTSPLTRTKNFYQDPIDGQPFNDYDATDAKQLLKQEKFDSYKLVNLVGGKSWIVDGNFVGFFASISNILNTKYRTGGYEQSRNANFRTMKEDQARDIPLFSPKYWFGYGTTYYLNFYVRF